MANRYPQTLPTAQPRTAVLGANIPNMFPGTTAWSQQPARSQIEQNEKHKEYLKQQQKLRLMAATSASQNVSADALIENLLGKKETFKPKTTQTSSGTATIPASLPVIGGVGFGSMAPLHMSYAPPPSVSAVPPQTLVGGFASPAVPPAAAEPINQPYKAPFLSTVNPNVSGINSQTKVAVALQFGAAVPPGSVSLPTWLCPSSQTLPQFYKQVWKLVVQEKGLVDTKRIFPILLTSGLPTDILGFIWGMANHNATGQLTEQELYIVLALVALAQNGCTFNSLNILNLIPQAPIPNLNLANIEPAMPYVGGESSTAPTQVKMRREELNLNPTPSVRDSSSAPSFLDDDGFDDFTDFQSAVPATDEIISQPLPASLGSLTNRDTASPPVESHLPEVMVEAPFVQKFPSVMVVTNSTGRSIGSRLANHSLGTPKPSKIRHHKHHHHHHHHHHRSQTQMTNQVPSSADDDFTDFQQARDITPSVNEAFPKCVMKQPIAKTYLLKESAIRSEVEPTNKEPTAAKSINVQFSNENEKQKANIDTRKTENNEQEKNRDITLTTGGSVSSQQETKAAGTKDLMLIEEDKYSALRNLSLAASDTASATTDHSPASDEFGDFLSAEPVQSVDDSFADIATRSNNILGAVGDAWEPSAVNGPQPVEFAVDDWGDFEEAPQAIEDTSTVNSLATDVSLSLMGLDLNASYLKQDKSSSEITDPASGEILDSKASSTDIHFCDSWDFKTQDNQESFGHFSSVSANNTEEFSGFLGKIYSTGDKLEHHDTKPDIFDSENDYLQRNTLESDHGQCHNDDFGEFVGPETWTEQKYEATGKDIAIENQLAIGLYADTQSVSSLELPPLALSRHGSVPSLDLKIFPSSTERGGGNGGNQPWDLSPQGIDHQLSEWQRCLRSCLTLLQATVNIFGNVSKEEVVEEVVDCSEGKSYLQNLLEVYGVCRRVEWSYKQMGSGAENKEIDSLLADIYSAWTFLESLYVKADIPIGPNFGIPVDGSNREAATSCGVCLTDVAAGKTEKSIMNTSQLEYGGHVYHSACANLWVNCVDSSLPALATGGSAFL